MIKVWPITDIPLSFRMIYRSLHCLLKRYTKVLEAKHLTLICFYWFFCPLCTMSKSSRYFRLSKQLILPELYCFSVMNESRFVMSESRFDNAWSTISLKGSIVALFLLIISSTRGFCTCQNMILKLEGISSIPYHKMEKM